MQTNQPSNSVSDWAGKRVFITGGTGFLGTHLAKRLHGLGAQLGLFIHTRESPLSAKRIYGNLQYSAITLRPFLQAFKPDVVFHLASQPLVSKAMYDEITTLETNIGGTYRVLHACKELGLKSFVHISTDKVYGDISPIKKSTPMNGVRHPYNASKYASDVVAQMYGNFFEIPMFVIRNANVYGAGDTHFDRIVPRTIFNVIRGEPPVIRGDGKNTRDYIHVDDLVDGYMKSALLPPDRKMTILNLSGFNYSTLEVIDTVLEK